MNSSKITYLTGVSEHVNHLRSIKATPLQLPTLHDLEKYIPEFVAMTWLNDPQDIEKMLARRGMTRADVVDEMFAGRTLPTALETIRITMVLEGLDMTNVTHILRHRLFGFSAQSSGWGTMEGHNWLHNDAWEAEPELFDRAVKLCNMSMQLYKDALDSGMNFYDARHYLMHNMEQKYCMTGDLKAWIGFITQRLDRTNQPTSDNILALRCRQVLVKAYPQLESRLPLEPILGIYINAINSKFNVNTYPPDAKHRAELEKRGIDWGTAIFDNDKPRDEYKGNDAFITLFNEILEGEA